MTPEERAAEEARRAEARRRANFEPATGLFGHVMDGRGAPVPRAVLAMLEDDECGHGIDAVTPAEALVGVDVDALELVFAGKGAGGGVDQLVEPVLGS